MPETDTTTRETILDAAELLFARQGFAATTIKQIGAEARVNAALIYYYFDDKTALYRATLARLFGGLSGGGLERLDPALPPAAQLEAFVGFLLDFMTSRPHAPRLLVREMIDHDAAHAVAQITQISTGLFKRLCDVVEAGQRSGAFRAGVDPRFAAISTIGQVAYFLIARPAIGRLLGEGGSGPSPDTVRAYGRHAAAFALAALADPDAPRARRRPRRTDQ